MIALPNVGRADEPRPQAVDTEHIFGFTEGADIGGKGELEIENNLVGLLGRPRRFVAFDNETDLRYGVEEHFRASFGILTDYHNVSGAAGLTFSGISSEFRRQVSNSADSPAGLTISFAPFWRRIDDTSGRPIESYSLPTGLLADTMLVPDKTLAGLNIIFSPTFSPTKQRSPLPSSSYPALWPTEPLAPSSRSRKRAKTAPLPDGGECPTSWGTHICDRHYQLK